MNMDLLYYVFLFITVISFLIGLFLSQFEKNEKMASVNVGDARFLNTFDNSDEKKVEEEII